MYNVFIRLNSYLPSATESEKNVINYILNDYEDVINEDIRTVSKKTLSSSSTIIRLCKKLGFKGFKQLKEHLIYDVAIQKSNKNELSKSLSDKDDLDKIVEVVTEKSQKSIVNTSLLINREDLIQTVKLIENSIDINLFGMGSSLLVAKDMRQKFIRVNKKLNVDDDWHMQYLSAKNSDNKSLAIIFSYSGDTEEMIECNKALREAGTKIILITGFLNSYLARNSDIVLQVAPIENIFRMGAFSSRISQLFIVDLIYSLYINRNYEDSLEKIIGNFIEKGVNSNEKSV